MRDLDGTEIGTTIPWRGVTEGQYITPVEAKHPWPAETGVSAGRGVVLGKDPYRTLFIEVYPPEASFIRGEGATPEECEDAAWAKYQRALHCPGPTGEHEWEARGYTNGAGFCKHCGTFKAGCFTAEDLGLFCHECGIPANWDEDGNGNFACKDHPFEKKKRSWLERLADAVTDTVEEVLD